MTTNPGITPDQLATILTQAANCRRDVRKARITPAPDDPTLLLASFDFYDGSRRDREASVSKILDGRTCGQILDDWIGAEAGESLAHTMRRKESIRLVEERDRYMTMTPQQALEYKKTRRPVQPAPQSEKSKLDWKPEPDETELPGGVLPAPIPEEPTQADGRPAKLTRQQMIDQGMDAAARHEQYRLQGGKHPDDTRDNT